MRQKKHARKNNTTKALVKRRKEQTNIMLIIGILIVVAAFAAIIFLGIKNNSGSLINSYPMTTIVQSNQTQNLPAIFATPPKLDASHVPFNAISNQFSASNLSFTLNAKWGSAAKKMVDAGALNVSSLSSILIQSGQPLTKAEKAILNGTYQGNIVLNSTDSQFVLDVLWGIGINNNNPIVNNGPLTNSGNNPNYFASTGGYTPLGKYQIGGLNLIPMTSSQQSVVNSVAYGSYRPCCNNPTAFPDCNHGAAALALVELMASQGNSLNATFEAVKNFDSLYFASTEYLNAIYFASQGVSWANAPAQEVVSFNFSSYSGSTYVQQYLSAYKLLPGQNNNGGQVACGV